METIDLAKDPYYMRNHLGQVRLLPQQRITCQQQQNWLGKISSSKILHVHLLGKAV
jgi:hypothetical protein